MRRFYKEYLRTEQPAFLCVALLHVLFAAALIVPPMLIKAIIDDGIADENLPLIFKLAGVLTAVFVVVALVGKIRSHWGHIIAQRVCYALRNDLYAQLQRLPFRFYDNIKTGELLSRVIDDLNSVQEILYHGPENLVTNGFMILFTGIMVFTLNWQLASLCASIMVLVALCNYTLSIRMFRGARRVREAKASLASRTEDNLSGIRIIQSFVRESFEMERFERENREHYQSRLGVIAPMSSLFPLSILVLGVALGLAAGLGGMMTVRGAMSVGALTAFIMYMHRFMWPMLAISMISEAATRFAAGIERFFAYMDIEPEIRTASDAVHLEKVRGEIEFRDVSFRYEQECVLENISLHIRPGETVALVGPSGAGKSTITRLVPRFYDAQEGNVLIDGIDTRKLDLPSLRSNIGIVMQDDFLFTDTLFNNIRYGRLDATHEETVEAARQGNVTEFVPDLPEGFETEVGQRGTKLSEGQAQRVSIARAILKDAPIFILDEATSSVDSHTEKLIQEALDNLMRGRTCIVIAHRLSTIRNADRILFIERGRIAEQGTHRELLDHGGKYAHFHNLQFKLGAIVA